jgi:hypothetical protein
MGDPSVKEQLLSGFYNVEGTGWRWAARQFAVFLKPPSGVTSTGARLKLDFYIPQTQIDTLGPMTLSAVVDDGCALEAETFSKTGSFTYARDIPASETAANVIRVDFRFDRAKPPSAKDARELTVVVNSAGLESK